MQVSTELRRYSKRHDVLRKIADAVKEAIPTTGMGQAQSHHQYDLVWWDVNNNTLAMLELTIPYDTLTEEAAKRKNDAHENL